MCGRSFIHAGMAATGFVFGCRLWADAEKRYRHAYHVQYHRPQGHLHQPMAWTAACIFNRFFHELVATAAAAHAAPQWTRSSTLAPHAGR